jgi:2-polyprenyl-6-hydroxyphenyl methylase/3-demethylubiquinone-9 3-methyltransferase
MAANNMRAGSTVDPAEVERFSKLAADWWDPRGPMAVLHKFNPVRLTYIRDQVAARFQRDAKRIGCLSGLRILDVGCGGGLLCEPLTRLGAAVTGIDPAAANVEIAKRHAQLTDMRIDYRCVNAEDLANAGERFDVVLAMEVVEHVSDVEYFVRRCADMVKPRGMMIAATLNRTMKSFALAIVGAEYVLRWLPRGTHTWGKFVTPRELESAMAEAGLTPADRRGVIYHIVSDTWRLSDDMDVNYMMVGEKG